MFSLDSLAIFFFVVVVVVSNLTGGNYVVSCKVPIFKNRFLL